MSVHEIGNEGARVWRRIRCCQTGRDSRGDTGVKLLEMRGFKDVEACHVAVFLNKVFNEVLDVYNIDFLQCRALRLQRPGGVREWGSQRIRGNELRPAAGISLAAA